MSYDNIRQDLISLGYKGLLQSFDELSEIQNLSMDFKKLFAQMIKAEVSHRQARSLAYRLDLARLPQIKLLDDFELDDLPFDQDKIDELSCFNFIHSKENILLVGSSGTGKTHLALALGFKAINNGFRTKYYRFSELATELMLMNSKDQFKPFIERLKRFDLLIIDELGYLPIDVNAGSFLFELFAACYEATAIIISTHLAFDEWGELFGNKKSTKAIIDRITHHCQILETGNKSWRLKAATKNKEEKEKKATKAKM